MNRLGAKLTCSVCGAQVIVIKAGGGQVTCHERPMEPAEAASGGAGSGAPAR